MKISTTERRKTYTPEQLAAEAAWRKAYKAKNAELLRAKSRGKYKPGSAAKRAAKMTPEERTAHLAVRRARYQKNKMAVLAYAAEYRDLNRVVINEKNKAREQTPERIAYVKAYNAERAEKHRQRRREWTAKNRDRVKQMNALWSQNNLDRHRTYQHNRRAKIIETGGKLSPDLASRLYTLQRGRCACCGKKLGDDFHLDHIIPLARGGTNTDDNIQLLTSHCNWSKGAKLPIDYMQARGRLL